MDAFRTLSVLPGSCPEPSGCCRDPVAYSGRTPSAVTYRAQASMS